MADIYAGTDRAIRSMNRSNLREFDKLKLTKWDELNVIRKVTELYQLITARAKREFLEIAFDAYIIALYECSVIPKTASMMAEESITEDWLLDWLEETDPVTLYRFDTETERKKQRLIEALGVTNEKDEEIDKALRYWVKQIGQYAVTSVDQARMQAFKDAGIRKVRWVTANDERVCDECGPLHGKVYEIDKVPPKPHWGCRCWLEPVKN